MSKNKDLDKKLSKYIIKAADEIIKGKHADNFPLKGMANRFWNSNKYERKRSNCFNRAIQMMAEKWDRRIQYIQMIM